MKLRYFLLILGTLVVVLAVSLYVNSYLQRPRATETAACSEYIPVDRNMDGVIDGFDYIIWRKDCPGPLVLNVKEDAFVNAKYTNNNYGNDGNLRVKNDPEKQAYIKYDLITLAGLPVYSAKLRIWVADPSDKPMLVRSVADNSWTESGITYNNRPLAGETIASFMPASAGTYQEIDITKYTVESIGKMMSLAIQTSGTNELAFRSRNVTEIEKRPVLIIETSGPVPISPTVTPDINIAPKITAGRIEGLLEAPADSTFQYIAPINEPLDPIIEGYDTSDDVSAAVEMALPDGSIVNTSVNIDLPELPGDICTRVKCFTITTDNFTTTQLGYHKITIRVADSKGKEAPPIVYKFLVVSDSVANPVSCTSNTECLSYQSCDLVNRQCQPLTCPVPPQCKIYKTENHDCLIGNSPDGMLCTMMGSRGICQSGICVSAPIPISVIPIQP